MAINSRTKGGNGEREVCKQLNDVVRQLHGRMGLEPLSPEPFQRNQLQSAVGGSDISNPYKLSIEVKRGETLRISQWWKQCIENAVKDDETPILIYRQNGKSWRVMMFATILPLGKTNVKTPPCVVTIHMRQFLEIFQTTYHQILIEEMKRIDDAMQGNL